MRCCTLKCQCITVKSARKEIWRLRFNWLFFMVVTSLSSLSYTSVLSSYHQFLTNPRAEELNATATGLEITPGLGESESFYSWSLTVFNGGAIFGGITSGFLIRIFPYWHVTFTGLVLHTVSYIMYGLATDGWVIIVSKFFSGVFIGIALTVAFSYFGESYEEYTAALKKLGQRDNAAVKMRDKLFGLHSVAHSIGYLFGPGVAAIFAQTNIDQFRAIAWYNVAAGVAVIIFQFFTLHGVSECKNFPCKCKCSMVKVSKPSKINCHTVVAVFIPIFMMVGRGVASSRFCIYETLFNPILSDAFGFNEKDQSYFFLGLVGAQIIGSIVLILLQLLRLNNRIIAIMGFTLSIMSMVLMADWQAVGYDRCTKLSLYHNPQLEETYAKLLTPNSTTALTTSSHIQCHELQISRSNASAKQYHGSAELYAYFNPSVDFQLNYSSPASLVKECSQVESCSPCDGTYSDSDSSTSQHCLPFVIDFDNRCLKPVVQNAKLQQYIINNMTNNTPEAAYKCTWNASQFSLCIRLHCEDLENCGMSELTETVVPGVQIQSLQIVDEEVYEMAMNTCEFFARTSFQCQWIPNSRVTNRHCDDCQPICRGKHRTLAFTQFTLGAILLLISIPVVRESMIAILSDISSQTNQGIIMGVAVATSGISRAIAPLWLIAAYEGAEKRTFLPMSIMIALLLPFLAGLILLYPKLQYQPEQETSGEELELQEGKLDVGSDEDEAAESDLLMSTSPKSTS